MSTFMKCKIKKGRDLLPDTLMSSLERWGLRIIFAKTYLTYVLHLFMDVYGPLYAGLYFSLLICRILFSFFHLDYSTPARNWARIVSEIKEQVLVWATMKVSAFPVSTAFPLHRVRTRQTHPVSAASVSSHSLSSQSPRESILECSNISTLQMLFLLSNVFFPGVSLGS